MEIFEAVKSLSSLAHETRLGIFRQLVQAGAAGLSVGEVNSAMQIPAPTLSFHLKELANAGLVTSRHEGRFIYYQANYTAMNELLAYLTENCCQGESCMPANKCKPGAKR
ncbi:helix-turn-helix transcriptional regulator [Betaproteobacteria bacterium SCN2]|jgi:DNA-binding transcriptional ArsR family regulator|nr:helix-turn-helix transcriptional regulator [Betaproteobacteria bacterium SCN2]